MLLIKGMFHTFGSNTVQAVLFGDQYKLDDETAINQWMTRKPARRVQLVIVSPVPCLKMNTGWGVTSVLKIYWG